MPSHELTQTQQVLANTIFEVGAFKTGAFKLKLHETQPDAPISPYYVSMRLKDMNGATDKEKAGNFDMLCGDMVNAIYEDTKPRLDEFKHVVGIPKAGEPIAADFAETTNTHLLTMEKIEGPSSRKISSTIHGDFNQGDAVLGIDDLITGADTKFEFKEGLAANGLVLAHLAVGIDRQQGGIEKLRQAGVSVSASLTIDQMLDYYMAERFISQNLYDQIQSYRASQT